MKTIQTSRAFVIFSIALLILTFLVGTALAFSEAKAATVPTLSTTEVKTPSTASLTAEPVDHTASANMTGIILLGILVVAIIAIGLLWGGRVTHK